MKRLFALTTALLVALTLSASAGFFTQREGFSNPPVSGGGGTAPTFGWINNGNTTSTTASVSNGANTIASGDVLVVISNWNNGAADAGTITPPAGWTQVDNNFDNQGTSAEIRTGVFIKVAGGSETPPYSFTVTNSSPVEWVLIDYKGSTGLDGAVGTGSGAGTDAGFASTLTGPSVTATGSTDRLIRIAMADSSRTVSTGYSGMTQRIQSNTNNLITVYDQALVASGSTGTSTLTITSSSNSNRSVALVLHP